MAYGFQIFDGKWKDTRLHDTKYPETWESEEEAKEVLKKEIPGWLHYEDKEFPGVIRVHERV